MTVFNMAELVTVKFNIKKLWLVQIQVIKS